jgi:hypothetical protein
MRLETKHHNNKLNEIGHFVTYSLYDDLNRTKNNRIYFRLLNNNKLNICLR